MSAGTLKAPFPAFGGKSRIAALVWSRLGDVRNYIEPFCFSAAMLLLRPHDPRIETINDLNAFVANFWRAIQADPAGVAHHADWPMNETDLHARHRWLVSSDSAAEKLQKVCDDPEYFDTRIAGWWCWGACMWIGSGWCDEAHRNSQLNQRMHLATDGKGNKIHRGPAKNLPVTGENTAGRGVHSPLWDGRGSAVTTPRGVHRKRPNIGSDGSQHGKKIFGRPQLADAYSRGRGVHSNDKLTDCQLRHAWLVAWMTSLADRLRAVRVCCGHWNRVCNSESTLTRLGLTGVLLDPPYRKKLACGTKNRASHIYATDKTQDVDALCDEVQAWCLQWGSDPQIRIALCGLEGEYPLLANWEKVSWKSNGGYGNRSGNNENASRERIWFSPACLAGTGDDQLELFGK